MAEPLLPQNDGFDDLDGDSLDDVDHRDWGRVEQCEKTPRKARKKSKPRGKRGSTDTDRRDGS